MRPSNSPPVHTATKVDWLVRLLPLLLAGLSLGALALLIGSAWTQTRTKTLVLAAGDKTGDSYILSNAIQKVVERNSNGRIKIVVYETPGTTNNLQLLDKGEPCSDAEKRNNAEQAGRSKQCRADLATALASILSQPKVDSNQADESKQSKATIVAILFQDVFQLIVKDPKIQTFTDLKRKRIGLQGSGGQFDSFIAVAEHYGLQKQDFDINGLDGSGKPNEGYRDQQANSDFWDGTADAVFRVRAPGSRSVAELIEGYKGKGQPRMVPIADAKAMKVRDPAFEPVELAKGTYKGSDPAIPETDLPTVGVQRLLVANRDTDKEVIREVTRILDEHRQELVAEIPPEYEDVRPLVASIRRPESSDITGAAIHPGALEHYERDKPSFVQENADYVGLLLTLGLLAGSWFWELKKWIERRKKNVADNYIQRVINLIDDPRDPKVRLEELDDEFEKAAKDMIEENISQESFRTFNEAYSTVRKVIERRMKQQISAQKVSR